MIENKDFELIPSKTEHDNWNVRILSGDFIETVFQFLAVRITPEELKFNFEVLDAPSDYITVENKDLHAVVGEILINIVETSIKDGSAIFNEVKSEST